MVIERANTPIFPYLKNGPAVGIGYEVRQLLVHGIHLAPAEFLAQLCAGFFR